MSIGEVITKLAMVWSFYNMSVPYRHLGVDTQDLSYDWAVKLSILFVTLSFLWDWFHRSQRVIVRMPMMNYALWLFLWQAFVCGISLCIDLLLGRNELLGKQFMINAGSACAMFFTAITAVCEVLGSLQYLAVKHIMTDMRESYYAVTKAKEKKSKRKRSNSVRVSQFCPVCSSSIHPMVGYCEYCGPYYEYCKVVDSIPCLPCNPKR